MNRRTAHGLAALGAGYAVMHWLGRTWSSTAAERRRVLPGDGLVTRPTLVTNHAITIDAPPAQRLAVARADGLAPRRLVHHALGRRATLFPANGPSADRIIPELQDLAVGSFVPDGPPESECGFVVVELEPNRTLVLHSREHLPRSWRAAHAVRR